MALVAKVAVDVALDRLFDYAVPAHLAPTVRAGARVEIPFGRRWACGYILSLQEDSDKPGLRPIRSVLTDQPAVDELMLDLARWMAEYYCAPIEHALRTVLPSPVRRSDVRFRKPLYVARTVAPETMQEGSKALRKTAPAQSRLAALLAEREGAYLQDLLREARTTMAAVRALIERGWVAVERRIKPRTPASAQVVLPTEPLELMPQQKEALGTICRAMDAGRSSVVLLHGVTGSGKTEVYLQAMAHAMRQGRGAIVLVPEIALTPQTIERFRGRFGDQVAVLHSRLSDGERHDEWHRIRDGKARVVVGARSAVFAPVHPLGLLVVDEEHEATYKQEESPRYNARDVAVMRGRSEGCVVVLGSATPSLESWWNARRGKYALARLPYRVDHRSMPVMRVVDMRLETAERGRHALFSKALMDGIRSRLERGEQTMLFLNRRGYATSLLCLRCGYVAACEHCSVAFTYHRADESLRCHICGDEQPVPAKCPKCGDPQFKMAGLGTQRVEAAVAAMFPKAAVRRMDADATTDKDAHGRILGEFRTGKIDILVGTQMIAKGLHFPNVTLIGVVCADMGLHLPDFRAGERTFHLLTQVAGRAGRGEVPGEVIVQTYTPFHAAIQAARRLDYEGFSDQELEFRRQLAYPPFSRLICLEVRGRSEERTKYCAEWLARQCTAAMPTGVRVGEAAPAPLARARGVYRYQVMLRSPSLRRMNEPLRKVLKEFKRPADVTCTVDVDALSLL